MVGVLSAQKSVGDCNDHVLSNERNVTKTLHYVPIFIMTALCRRDFTLFQGDYQSLCSYPLDS